MDIPEEDLLVTSLEDMRVERKVPEELRGPTLHEAGDDDAWDTAKGTSVLHPARVPVAGKVWRRGLRNKGTIGLL